MSATATQPRRERPGDASRPTQSRHVDPTRRSQAVAAWILALPFCALFLVFTAGPVLASLGMSFTDMRSTDVRNPLGVEFVGLENYADLIADPLFRKVTLNTLRLPGARRPADDGESRWRSRSRSTGSPGCAGFFRVGYYLPVVTSIVAVSVVWKFLLRDEGGLVNVDARLGRRRRPRLAGLHHAGPAVAGGHVGVAQLRHPDGDLPGRPADHPARGRRGRRGRRRHRRGAASATSRCRCCARRCSSAR